MCLSIVAYLNISDAVRVFTQITLNLKIHFDSNANFFSIDCLLFLLFKLYYCLMDFK